MLPDLHLDPNSTGKIAVCSLHFKEGHPTPEFQSPTELLSSKDSENATEFRGTKPTTESVEVLKNQSCQTFFSGSDFNIVIVEWDTHYVTCMFLFQNSENTDAMETEDSAPIIEEKIEKVSFKKFVVKKVENDEFRTPFLIAKAKHRKALAALRKRRKWIPSNICGDKKMAELRRRLFATSALFGSRISCKFVLKNL